MSVFGSIMSKIFGHHEAGSAPAGQASPAAPQQTSAATPAPRPASPTAPGGSGPAAAGTPASAGMGGPAATGQQVDVAAVLDQKLAQKREKLDWRHSIVDLMKLLDLDSGLAARKDLAQELGYTGDTGDSAGMNVWLHKQVMQKLAQNGGKVPADLAH